MVYENGDQQSNGQCSIAVLKIIYDDANDSLKLLRDDINLINTRLTFLIGFNATFASLLPRLPVQSFFSINHQPLSEFGNLYPYAKSSLNLSIVIINWLLLTKPLIALFLGASVTFAIFSLLPAHTPMYILPKKMLEKGKDHSEEDFRLGIIKNRDGTIQRLQSLSSRKASRLKHALMTLGGAALLTVFDMLTNVNMQLL